MSPRGIRWCPNVPPIWVPGQGQDNPRKVLVAALTDLSLGWAKTGGWYAELEEEKSAAGRKPCVDDDKEPEPRKNGKGPTNDIKKLQKENRRLKEEMADYKDWYQEAVKSRDVIKKLERKIERLEATPVPELQKEIRRLQKEVEHERLQRQKLYKQIYALGSLKRPPEMFRTLQMVLHPDTQPTSDKREQACAYVNDWRDIHNAAFEYAEANGWVEETDPRMKWKPPNKELLDEETAA